MYCLVNGMVVDRQCVLIDSVCVLIFSTTLLNSLPTQEECDKIVR